jgi:hypothetical protein
VSNGAGLPQWTAQTTPMLEPMILGNEYELSVQAKRLIWN